MEKEKSVQEQVEFIMKEKSYDNATRLIHLEVMLTDEQLSDDDKAVIEKAIQEVKWSQSEVFTESLNGLFDDFTAIGSYLEELHVLRRFEKLIASRIKEISDDALKEGMDILQSETPKRESGAFEFNGYQFEISAKPVYDFVDHAPRYTMPEGVEYRALYQEKMRLSELSKAKTQKMAAITKSFPIEHPDWTPDWTELVIKCK